MNNEQSPSVKTFAELGLSTKILDALSAKGYETPTAIQAEAIPYILEGRDLLGAAQTGTGKTAGFTLPLLELLSKGRPSGSKQVRALILTPTRELAAQVAESVETYGRNLYLSSEVIFGGVKINPQKARLKRGVDILVATPGRLLDLYQQQSVKFDELEVFILDEADSMLDMGFIHDVKKITRALPNQRQNLMFSATFSDEIYKLAQNFLKDPVEVSVTPKNKTAKTVNQWIHPLDKSKKSTALTQIIKASGAEQALVFTRTKHGADRVARYLKNNGIAAAAIHGNKRQNERVRTLANFKSGQVQILVATDIAARGLDIQELPRVVNYDLPSVPEDYVHRIGRTGRAGASGEAISLVSADEVKQLNAIEKVTKQLLERKMLTGLEPEQELPKAAPATAKNKPRRHNSRRKPAGARANGRKHRGTRTGSTQ